MITPSKACKEKAGEPSSYLRMEQALWEVAKSGAEDLLDDGSGGCMGVNGALDSVKNTLVTSSAEEFSKPPENGVFSSHSLSNTVAHPGESITSNLSTLENTTMHSGALHIKPLASQIHDVIVASTSSGSLHSSASMQSKLHSPVMTGALTFSPQQTQAATLESTSALEGSTAEAAMAGAASMASATRSSVPVTIQPSQAPSERSTKSKGTLRRGKWTTEEEAYVARVIQDFNSGLLDAPAGTTLRSYLSDKLQCDPMRITKKFTGESCIGKRVFHPAVRSAANAAATDKAQEELNELERRWKRRLEMQQRESAKKAAASVAAANAATRGESTTMVQGVPVAMLGGGASGSTDSHIQATAVTQAASWLDRANAILKGSVSTGTSVDSSNHNSTSSSPQPKDESTLSSGDDSLENQMKEVQRLIFEGPAIQQTAAGLPNLLQSGDPSASGLTQSAFSNSVGAISPNMEPADKRMKTTETIDHASGAEDAEALMGFLTRVRASAAAGNEL